MLVRCSKSTHCPLFLPQLYWFSFERNCLFVSCFFFVNCFLVLHKLCSLRELQRSNLSDYCDTDDVGLSEKARIYGVR